jgi:hypothetical protein
MKRQEGGENCLMSEEYHSWYCSPDIGGDQIKRVRWVGYVAHMGVMRNV